MQEGLYKVEFQTPLGRGAGVIVLADGKVRGGDSMMLYAGTYQLNERKVTATVSWAVHTPTAGMASVLGSQQGAITLAGEAVGDSAVLLTGTSPQAPGVSFTASLTFLRA